MFPDLYRRKFALPQHVPLVVSSESILHSSLDNPVEAYRDNNMSEKAQRTLYMSIDMNRDATKNTYVFGSDVICSLIAARDNWMQIGVLK